MNYTNKTIGIWGYGRVGKAAAQFLLERGATITIYDEKPIQAPTSMQIAKSVEQLFESDYLLPSPGVDTQAYRTQYKGKWLCELDLFHKHFHKPIIAISGSVGKTTVTHLLAQALAAAGWRVEAIGNIGVPCLDIVKQQDELDAVVLEVSSFQLEFAKSCAPDLAIWTNLYPNHLDRHGSMQDYFEAKSHLIRYQTKEQSALLPAELHQGLHDIHLKSSLSFFGKAPKIPNYPFFSIENQEIHLQNRDTTTSIIPLRDLDQSVFPINWLMVYAALHLLKVTPQPLAIKPISHRLELVATIAGVTFYNDSKSTTPASTQAALATLAAPRTILFLGGLSKGIDRSPLIQSLQNTPLQVICFGKEAALLHQQCTALQIPSHSFATLDEAFQLCTMITQPNDCVLFSPAGSSFDLFENYEKRGEEFKALVLRYGKTTTIS